MTNCSSMKGALAFFFAQGILTRRRSCQKSATTNATKSTAMLQSITLFVSKSATNILFFHVKRHFTEKLECTNG